MFGKKMLSLALALSMLLTLGAGALAQEETTLTVFCDGSAAYKVEAEQRDAGFTGDFFFVKYFGEDVKAGMKNLIAEGGVSVNGFAIPSAQALRTEVDAGGSFAFGVNGGAGFTVTADSMDSAADDALAVIAGLFKASGTQVTLTLAGDTVTKMDVFSTAGVLVDHLAETDGIITAYTDSTTPFVVTSGFGPDAVKTDVVFSPENVVDVTDGCIAVYWEGPDGWHLQAGESIRGCLTDGADHAYYVLEDENGHEMRYVDAEMYSRGFSEGSRPGQFTNTQMNFGLSDIEITVWFVPGTLNTDNPMPIGITGLEHASLRLERAIAYTEQVLFATVIAQTAEDAAAKAAEQGLGEDYHWVTEAVTTVHVSDITGKESRGVLDMVNAKLDEAKALLADAEASPASFDQEAYELYLAMWGSSSDIGAVFMGMAEEGFFDVADAGVYALPAAVLK